MADFEAEDLDFLRALLGGDGLHGPGDDAAVLEARGRVVASCDGVIEGVHFAQGTAPRAIAHKLVHRNFSDLAAMGALPRQILLGCCFGPGWKRSARRAFYRAVLTACAREDCAWIGGDLAATPGPSTFHLTVLGVPAGKRLLRRSALRPGDLLAVSGPLGDSLASGHHLRFRARLAAAARLVRAHPVRAAMDLSDGLALDLSRMLAASGGLGATLFAERLPLRASLRRRADRTAAIDAALADGEDYELLIGYRPALRARLAADPDLPRKLARPIGVVEAEPGLRLRWANASAHPLAVRGWLHGHA